MSGIYTSRLHDAFYYKNTYSFYWYVYKYTDIQID